MGTTKKGTFKIQGSTGLLFVPSEIVKASGFPLEDGYKVLIETTKDGLIVKALPRFEHMNVYEDHATIYDNKEATEIDVYFSDRGVWCDHDKTFQCQHIEFLKQDNKFQRLLRDKGIVLKGF